LKALPGVPLADRSINLGLSARLQQARASAGRLDELPMRSLQCQKSSMKRLPSRVLAWIAVVTWLSGIGAPVLGAHAIVDVDCGDVILSSARHDTPAVETDRPAFEHEHCLLCHFQRDLRSAWSGGVPADTAFRVVEVNAAKPDARLRDRSRVHTPSRGPPFLLS
jgi:hypothetical protein